MMVNQDVVDVYTSWKNENTPKNAKIQQRKEYTYQLKRAQFSHLACQGCCSPPCSPRQLRHCVLGLNFSTLFLTCCRKS